MEKENISDDLFSHGELSDPESDADQIGPISLQHYKDIKSQGRFHSDVCLANQRSQFYRRGRYLFNVWRKESAAEGEREATCET